MTNKTVTLKKNSVSSIETKRNQKKLEQNTKTRTFGFAIKYIADKKGNKMKCRMLTWTDLAILQAINGIKCPVFCSFIKSDDDIFFAIFDDLYSEERILYAVELGGYDSVAGSYINHDSEETADLWERLAPEK